MGWWSATVFGGDEPLDYLDAIGRLLAVEGADGWFETPDQWSADFADSVREKIEMFGGLDMLADALAASSAVGDQVLVSVACASGYPLDDTWIERGVRSCATNEPWAADNQERRAALHELSTLVESYDGTRRTQLSVGLFDVV